MRPIDADDRKRISAAVHEAERRTSGEIVTVLARRSDDYRDVVLAWGSLAIFMALGLLASVPTGWVEALRTFALGWQARISHHELLAVMILWLALKFIGACLIVSIWPVRMALTPPRLKARRVRARALDYFRVGAERRTAGRTAVLIYVSLAEHRVEVVADRHIHSKVAPERWGEAAAVLVNAMRDDRPADGLVEAIGMVGALLAAHFPPSDDNPNELPDRLIEVE